MNPRRLYRSRRDRQLAGVAAGMAEYLEIDPTLVRILWILSAFLGGFTILLYIIFAFVIPLDPAWMPASAPDGGAETPQWTAPDQRPRTRGGRGGLVVGVMLIVFGTIIMANMLMPGWAVTGALAPAFLVALGIALLVGSARRSTSEE